MNKIKDNFIKRNQSNSSCISVPVWLCLSAVIGDDTDHHDATIKRMIWCQIRHWQLHNWFIVSQQVPLNVFFHNLLNIRQPKCSHNQCLKQFLISAVVNKLKTPKANLRDKDLNVMDVSGIFFCEYVLNLISLSVIECSVLLYDYRWQQLWNLALVWFIRQH